VAQEDVSILTPAACAASTYVSSRMLNTSERMSRAKIGTEMMLTPIIA